MKRDRHFGNGRTSRNSFERSVRRLANRIASISDVTRDQLTTLEAEDIEVAGVTQSHLAAMAAQSGKVRVTCSTCDESMVIDDTLLGTEVQCESNPEIQFVAEFGEPVIELPEQVSEDDEPQDLNA